MRTMSDERSRSSGRLSPVVAFLAAGLTLPVSGCPRFAEPCPEVEFDEGDRIEVTVVGRLDPTVPSCGVLDLEPGASFELIRGPLGESIHTGCPLRTTLAIPPPQFAPVMTYCATSRYGTGIGPCDVFVSDSCRGQGGIGLRELEKVANGADESATLRVGWSEWSGDCEDRPACVDEYRVTVRLVEE